MTAQSHLRTFDLKGQFFLDKILTGNKTWARSYEPELKRQSVEWCFKGSPHPSKAVRGMAKLKSFHICFYTTKKLLVDNVLQGQTVDGYLYKWALIHLYFMRPALSKKQAEIWEKGSILLHDGAGPHRAAAVVQQLIDWQWEV